MNFLQKGQQTPKVCILLIHCSLSYLTPRLIDHSSRSNVVPRPHAPPALGSQVVSYNIYASVMTYSHPGPKAVLIGLAAVAAVVGYVAWLMHLPYAPYVFKIRLENQREPACSPELMRTSGLFNEMFVWFEDGSVEANHFNTSDDWTSWTGRYGKCSMQVSFHVGCAGMAKEGTVTHCGERFHVTTFCWLPAPT